MIKKGIAVLTYNRAKNICNVLEAVHDNSPKDCKIILCDDGSTDNTISVVVAKFPKITIIRGENLGVAANKNRALWGLQDCPFICLLEDDLIPTTPDWFDIYSAACCESGIHHFSRVQDGKKIMYETVPEFSQYMIKKGFTPIYSRSPRGDLTFLTSRVIREVGAFNPAFVGAGHAHGEWTERIWKSGLIPHPLKYIDIKEARDSFVQIGDTLGGRWDIDPEEIKSQISNNRKILKMLAKANYINHPLVLP